MKIYIRSCVRFFAFSFSQVDWIYIIIYLVSEKVTLSNGIQLAKSMLLIRTLNQSDPEMGNVPKRIDVCLKGKKIVIENKYYKNAK